MYQMRPHLSAFSSREHCLSQSDTATLKARMWRPLPRAAEEKEIV
jgi:hypothetical protein